MSAQRKSHDSGDSDHIPMADDGVETSADEDKQSLDSQQGSRTALGTLPTGMEGEDRSLSPVRISDPETSSQEQQRQTSFLFDSDLTPEEQEEKARLIAQVLELQNTLDDLSSRVDNVKEENLRLRSENQVLGQYIENLMAASSVFQPANEQPKSSRRK